MIFENKNVFFFTPDIPFKHKCDKFQEFYINTNN